MIVGALGGLVGGVDIGGTGQRDLGELLFVARIDGVEIFPRLRGDELAVDKKVVTRLQLRVRRLGRGIVFPEVAEDQLGRGTTVAGSGFGNDFREGIFFARESRE